VRFRALLIVCSVVAAVLGGVWALCSLHVPIPEPSRPLPEAAKTTESPANGNKVGAGACFLDMDGDLDLYSSNCVKFSYESHITRFHGGFHRYSSPKDHNPEPDTLFRNNGDGTFTDVSIESGVGMHAGTSMGMVGCDYDTDGDTDVFICNDIKGNFFFRNPTAPGLRPELWVPIRWGNTLTLGSSIPPGPGRHASPRRRSGTRA